MTFSCDNKQTLNKVKNIIEDIIKDEGFEVNQTKTRFLSPVSHKKVTGITINDSKIKACKVLKRKVRAMIHRSIATKDYNNNDKIRGYVSYINSIEGGYKAKVINYINKLAEKDFYTSYHDIVGAYNSNKIFKEAKAMIHDVILDDDLASDIEYERQEFLQKVKDEIASTKDTN